MAKIPITKDDLEGHLDRQTSYLEASSRSYDQGFKDEAHRMAVVIRVLLHDTQNSKSLLGQLGTKHANFLDTSHPYDPRNLLSHHGLVGLQIGSGGTGYVAFLGGGPIAGKWTSFQKWWNEIIFSDGQKRQISRSKLILTMANQDGGAHVDSGLDETYADLKKNNSLGWVSTVNGEPGQPLMGAENASMRQIAYEVLETLNEIKKNPPGPPPPPVMPLPERLSKRQARRQRGALKGK